MSHQAQDQRAPEAEPADVICHICGKRVPKRYVSPLTVATNSVVYAQLIPTIGVCVMVAGEP